MCHFYSCFAKVLVSSIKGQIWHLDLQQGALLLYEDDSHLILAVIKWSLSNLDFLQPIIGGLSPKTLQCSLLDVKRIRVSLRTFWKFVIGWLVKVRTNLSLFLTSLTLSDKVSLEKAMALRICFLTTVGL